MPRKNPKSDGTDVARWCLPNGLTVLHVPLPLAKKGVAMLGVRVGSTDETDAEAGTSHFLEHLAFKSTPRLSCAEMSRHIESLGGSINAFTDSFATVYELRAPVSRFLDGFEVLYAAVVNRTFDAAEFECEREVVLTEVAGNLESPEEYTRAHLYFPALFGRSAVARPIEGRPATVERFKVGDLVRWKRRHYRPANAILAIAGASSRRDIDEAIAGTFAGWRGAPGRRPVVRCRPDRGRRDGASRRIERWDDLEQVFLCVGVRTPSISSQDAASFSLLAAILGLGASSRLFRTLRDERGIGYDVVAEWESIGPVGHLFAAVPGFNPARFAEAERLVQREFARLAASPVSRREIDTVKALLLSAHDDAIDSPLFHAESVLYGEILNLKDDYRALKLRLDAVDPEKLRRVARSVLRRPLTVAALGPKRAKW